MGKIDLRARERLIAERRHKELVSTLQKQVTPPVALTEPMHDVAHSTKTSATVSAMMLGTLQKLVAIFTQMATQLPGTEDIRTFTEAIKKLTFLEKLEFVKLPPEQIKDVVASIRAIRIPDPPKEIKVTNLDSVVRGLQDVKKSFPKPLETIRVKNMPEFDTKPIVQAIETLTEKVKTSTPSAPPLASSPSVNMKPIIKTLEDIRIEMQKLNKKEIVVPDSVDIRNFPPQMVPTPVTNININSLRGIAHTTAATVTVGLTQLPAYGVLANRRALILYNNSSSVTIYIGGSDVTASNGLPVPPLTYSPPIDAGPLMRIYGVTASGSADIRVMEVSTDAIGS